MRLLKRTRSIRTCAFWATAYLLVSIPLISNGQGIPSTSDISNQEATDNRFRPVGNREEKPSSSQTDELAESQESQFDGQAAYEYLKQVCEIGPRVSGTKGMEQQQLFIKQHFEKLGASVTGQEFFVRHPETQQNTRMTNAIVRFHPERKKRLLICCHYDTRPYADRDPVNPRGEFIGANDGASGVALLCELGKHMPRLEGKYGIDFVFFDGEEFVYVYRRDPMFIGSTYFANQYAAGRFDGKYTYGILVDMVADKNLEIYYEGNSMGFAKRLTRSIWSVANQMGIKEFKAKQRHQIRDDHLPLNSIARIPTCDIIDFDYPIADGKNSYWHTQQDIPENCSADSLQKVGSVLLEWLRQMEKLR